MQGAQAGVLPASSFMLSCAKHSSPSPMLRSGWLWRRLVRSCTLSLLLLQSQGPLEGMLKDMGYTSEGVFKF